ncbi:Proliferating cell nuclear antigen [Nosema granulosis]|uniref:DNA sliding clamp PCNA n=1 Tax=Nosema granulosis TaxID=83296 RepID=A0A9P6H2X0_9MICR|nr:Proliferating cell nuclear antigen [Nosema granulosis]
MFELEISYQNKEEKDINFPGGKIGILKKILESISEIVDHVEIKTREHGIEMQVMDSMHAVLIDVLLDKALFDKYRCDRDITLGIKIKSFLTILRDISFTPDSVLHMSCEDSPTKMSLLYKQPGYKLNWDLSLYSYDTEVFSIPQMEYTTEVKMTTQQFQVLPKLVGIFGEFISIDTSKDMIIFKQVGDTTSASMTLKNKTEEDEEPNGVEINVSIPIKREIAMKYISTISKVVPLCSSVKIFMGEESPIFFDLSIHELGHMRYYIAPKVEN